MLLMIDNYRRSFLKVEQAKLNQQIVAVTDGSPRHLHSVAGVMPCAKIFLPGKRMMLPC